MSGTKPKPDEQTKLPDIYFGKVAPVLADWEDVDIGNDDDEDQPADPELVELLGFDPDEEDPDTETEETTEEEND